MNHKTGMPELRFTGFDSQWESKKVGELCDSIVPGRNKPTNFEGDIPWITTPDIEHNGIINHSKKGLNISREEAKKVGSKIVPINSIIISCVGELGLSAIAGKEIIINQQLHAFIPKERIEYRFLLYQLNLKQKYMDKVATKTAVPYMNKDNCNSIPIDFPTLPEQQKIASFLSSVDEKIQQLSRKKELLEQYKKGVMQQLFSGKLRFKDGNGNDYADWKWVGGNELFDNISDKKHNSDLPILAITQDHGAIPRELINYQMTVTDASVASYKVVQRGDFIISLRTFQGGIEFSEYHGICSPAYNILRPSSEEVDKTFYKLYLKTSYYIRQLQKNLEGIRDGKMISYKYFSEIKLPFPSQPEQQKIAAFLSNIDTKIESTNQQITQTQSFKKGLLQQMFV
jgi:type I restriction enzyme S subunit